MLALAYPPDMCAGKISTGVDGGLIEGTSRRRPGSEDPHQHQRILYYLVVFFAVLGWGEGGAVTQS